MCKPERLGFTLAVIALLAATDRSQGAPDVTFWTVRSSGTTARLRGVAHGDEKFIVVGDHGTVLSSSPVGWKTAETGVTNDLTGIVWGPSNFVAVGSAGMLLSSPDGLDWTVRESLTGEAIRCVTFGNGHFLALGSTNSLVSKDGITWTRYAIPTMKPEAVCFGNGRFVAVGGTSVLFPDGEICESLDGENWQVWRQGQSVYHDILFAEDYFTAVGEGMGKGLIQRCLLWRAPGLVEKGAPEFLEDANVETHRAIAFGDGVFVSVGGTRAVPNSGWIGKISTSPDGANPWTSQDQMIDPWPQTYFQLQALLMDVAHGAGKFVAVGEGGLLVESGAAARFDPRLARVQSNGAFQWGVQSPPGSKIEVDVTTDFRTWSSVLVTTNASGIITFEAAPKLKPEFFRAVLLSP